MNASFLTLDEVLAIHADQIRRYGGRAGLRDLGLLQSALAVPAATYGGAYLHGDIHEMASAYLFHVVRDHPFVDGNKRTGLMTMLVFLELNRLRLCAEADELVRLVLGVASGTVSKAEVAVFLKGHTSPPGRRRRG